MSTNTADAGQVVVSITHEISDAAIEAWAELIVNAVEGGARLLHRQLPSTFLPYGRAESIAKAASCRGSSVMKDFWAS